jgi:hypothetical protein
MTTEALMRSLRRIVSLGVASATLLGASLIAPPAADADGARPIDVLLEGLSSPKGLAVTGSDDLAIGQGAFGPPGPALLYLLYGRDRGNTIEVTEPLNLVDIAVSPLDDTGWGIGTDLVLYHQHSDGSIEAVLDVAAYQQTDPDPVDQDNFPEEANPYGLAALPNGDVLVADAAGNDVIRVSPDGDASTLARFDLETVSTDHLPPDQGLPPAMTAESVPTSIAIGKDGAVYVGELKGFPFRPGSSNVWRIDPEADGAFCSVNTPDPQCTVAADGFTAIQDIAINRHNRTMYVYELAAEGVLAFEAGLETGDFPPAVLLRVRRDQRTDLLDGQLSQPGGVVVGRTGRVYVTDGVFDPSGGRLIRVRG